MRMKNLVMKFTGSIEGLQTNVAKTANNVDLFVCERGLCALSFIISTDYN